MITPASESLANFIEIKTRMRTPKPLMHCKVSTNRPISPAVIANGLCFRNNTRKTFSPIIAALVKKIASKSRPICLFFREKRYFLKNIILCEQLAVKCLRNFDNLSLKSSSYFGWPVVGGISARSGRMKATKTKFVTLATRLGTSARTNMESCTVRGNTSEYVIVREPCRSCVCGRK